MAKYECAPQLSTDYVVRTRLELKMRGCCAHVHANAVKRLDDTTLGSVSEIEPNAYFHQENPLTMKRFIREYFQGRCGFQLNPRSGAGTFLFAKPEPVAASCGRFDLEIIFSSLWLIYSSVSFCSYMWYVCVCVCRVRSKKSIEHNLSKLIGKSQLG